MSRTSYYAGANKRFVAALIDSIFLSFVFFVACGKAPNLEEAPEAFLMYYFLVTVISWVYFAGLESSNLQATFGKRVLGIIVTDTNDNKISFAKATGRYFAKSICIIIWIVAFLIAVMADSTGGDNSPYWVMAGLLFIIGFLLLFIGYAMAAFTTEKQALHDIIARCLVVNGRGQSNSTPWKPLIGLALAAILSRGVMAQFSKPELDPDPIPTPVPTTPVPTPEPDPDPVPTLDEGESNEIPTSGRFTICGSEERLVEPGNSNIDGDWKLTFSGAGGVAHVARLQMQGDSGIMQVVFPNGSVNQTMQLYNSSIGLVLLGFFPVDPNTGEAIPSYSADNFLIRQELDESLTVLNCDDGGNNSPVSVEPYEEIE